MNMLERRRSLIGTIQWLKEQAALLGQPVLVPVAAEKDATPLRGKPVKGRNEEC